MKRIVALSALAAALFAAVPAFAQSKPIELKLGHYSVESHPMHLASLQFADAVASRTKGMVKVVIFPNSKLGNSQEILEQVSLGAVDFALPTEPAMAKYVKKFNLVTGPFAFKDYDATDRFFSGGFISWVSPDMERAGFKYLARWEWGFRNYTTSKRPVLVPADMKGLKIRTPPDFVNSATVKALGGTAQTIAFAELPMALKQGVVDGQENPIGVIYSNKMYETQKYLSVLNYTYNSTHMVMNKNSFARLSPENQRIVLEEAAKAGAYAMKTIRDQEAGQIVELKKLGMQVAYPDTAAFKKAASSVWDELKAQVGATDYNAFMRLLDSAK
jgi:tripartite ATP-independent transporter DctP family solute receptor